ncbi:MAG: ribose 5-phosphate isomerase B [Candidatus Saelkia tenebricola]|nr:ribose 5-phosphate isomerase B [Candidatus Saelkia tenebricola]
MKVTIASDHRGIEFKNNIKDCLISRDIDIIDVGAYDESPCDYPDFGKIAVQKIITKEADSAILICGSGIGMSIVANKFKGIRGALCLNADMAKMAREHNNANVLIFSANFTPDLEIKNILDNWFNSSFEGGRHERRLRKIQELE